MFLHLSVSHAVHKEGLPHRDPLDRDIPGQRPPWTETPLDRDHRMVKSGRYTSNFNVFLFVVQSIALLPRPFPDAGRFWLNKINTFLNAPLILTRFSRFTVVEVIDDADKLEELQTKEHGGFSSKMILACGVRGIVNRVKDGSVYVEMINGDK